MCIIKPPCLLVLSREPWHWYVYIYIFFTKRSYKTSLCLAFNVRWQRGTARIRPPHAAAAERRPAMLWAHAGLDRRKDGWTAYGFMDPAPHTMTMLGSTNKQVAEEWCQCTACTCAKKAYTQSTEMIIPDLSTSVSFSEILQSLYVRKSSVHATANTVDSDVMRMAARRVNVTTRAR